MMILSYLRQRHCWIALLFLILVLSLLFSSLTFASGTQRACAQGLVQQQNPLLQNASFKTGQKIPKWNLHITYIGHSTFLIETPQGVSAATDYNGVHVPPYVPDYATMNNLHDTHYTDMLNPK